MSLPLLPKKAAAIMSLICSGICPSCTEFPLDVVTRRGSSVRTAMHLMLLGRGPFRNDKCDRAFVERVVVRVIQFNEHFVRTGEKAHQDDWAATRICPHP